MDILEITRNKFKTLITEKGYMNKSVEVSIRGLKPEEAIGITERKDFPIIEGKEIMIEAKFMDSLGQAFTDKPVEFKGKIEDLIDISLDNINNRAILTVIINAVLRNLNYSEKTCHCKDDEPEKCAVKVLNYLKDKNIKGKIGIIGYQPAIIENITSYFKSENILVSDLNKKNIGQIRYGIKILDGKINNNKLIDNCSFILSTGSTIINGSFNNIYKYLKTKNKDYVFFGNTISGVASLMKIPHLCFYGR